jgi:hypothetical protein
MFSYIREKLSVVPHLEEWKREITDPTTFIFSPSPQVAHSLTHSHSLPLTHSLSLS